MVKILFAIIAFTCFPILVHAECPYNVQSKLKKVASNINYDYNYIENNGSVEFTIRFNNVTPQIYIYDETHDKSYYNNGNSELKISGFESGKQYKFIIKATDKVANSSTVTVPVLVDGQWVDQTYIVGVENDGCKNDILYTIYITLPTYNKYYNNPLCKGIESYSLCQKWNKLELNETEFEKQVNEYINKRTEQKESEKGQEFKSMFDYVIEFYQNYYLIILGGIIVGCSYMIYREKNKKGFEGW